MGGGAYAGTDSDQRSQGTLVEGEGALVLQDLGGAVQSTGVLGGGLQADLDNVCSLLGELPGWRERGLPTKRLSCALLVYNLSKCLW